MIAFSCTFMDDERGRDIRSAALSLSLNSEAKAEDGHLLIGGKRPLSGSVFTPEIASSSAAVPSVEPSLSLALPCDDYATTRAASRPQRVINSPFSSRPGLVRENDARCRISDDEEEEQEEEEASAAGRGTKKLRLSKEQSALLEDRFREHTNLNTKQKQALAKQLKLRTRQVEVWFQNRRARTKLKKTEQELEMLRKWCDTLREENRRLQRELQELQELIVSPHKLSSARYMQLPAAAAAFAICPSCKKVAPAGSSDDDGGGGAEKNQSFVAAPPPKPYFFINRFPRSEGC